MSVFKPPAEEEQRKPRWVDRGIPLCDKENCPSFGKGGCAIDGYEPARVCEPEIRWMYSELKTIGKVPRR